MSFEVYRRKPFDQLQREFLEEWSHALPDPEPWDAVIAKLPYLGPDQSTRPIRYTFNGAVHRYDPDRLRSVCRFGFPHTLFGELCGTGRGGKDTLTNRLRTVLRKKLHIPAAYDGERPRMFRAVMDPIDYNEAMALRGAALLKDWVQACKNGGNLPDRTIPKFVFFNRGVVSPLPFNAIYQRHFDYDGIVVETLARRYSPLLDLLILLDIPKKEYLNRGGTMSNQMFDELRMEYAELPKRIAKLAPHTPIIVFTLSGIRKPRDIAYDLLASIGTVLRGIFSKPGGEARN